MDPFTLLAIYSVAIGVVVWFGCGLTTVVRVTHRGQQFFLSLIGGLLLGVAVLHLVPHALAISGGENDLVAHSVLGGVLAMFFLLRLFHVHAHDMVEPEPHECDHAHSHDHDHGHDGHAAHSHDHSHSHDHGSHDGGAKTSSWSSFGLGLGLAVHTLIDGLALGAALQTGIYESIAVALAVILHKPIDAAALSVTMRTAGWTWWPRLFASFGFASMCPLGALFVLMGFSNSAGTPTTNYLLAILLAFSAGAFLCIALADLLPEVSFHSHDRLGLSGALLAGLALAWGIGLLEPHHFHNVPKPTSTTPETNEADSSSNHEHDHKHDHGHKH